MNIDVHMCVVPVKVLFRCQRTGITMYNNVSLGVPPTPTASWIASDEGTMVCAASSAADFLDFIEKK